MKEMSFEINDKLSIKLANLASEYLDLLQNINDEETYQQKEAQLLNLDHKINLDIKNINFYYYFSDIYKFKLSIKQINEPNYLENMDNTFALLNNFECFLTTEKDQINNTIKFLFFKFIKFGFNEEIDFNNKKIKILKISFEEIELVISSKFLDLLNYFNEFAIGILNISNILKDNNVQKIKIKRNNEKNYDIFKKETIFVFKNFKFKLEDSEMNVKKIKLINVINKLSYFYFDIKIC